jgi:hypothetical protein
VIFLKTNFVICSTKNMGKHFVLSYKLLHVACNTWPSLRNPACTATSSSYTVSKQASNQQESKEPQQQ